MSSTPGRRWLWLILERAGIFHNTENLDHAYMAWEKGVRNEALRILASIMKHTPDLYVRLTNENTAASLQESEPSDD